MGMKRIIKNQTPFDFSQIVEAIGQSSDADVQKALYLELPNNTVLWSNLLQFRADFTQRSSQETVFNHNIFSRRLNFLILDLICGVVTSEIYFGVVRS